MVNYIIILVAGLLVDYLVIQVDLTIGLVDIYDFLVQDGITSFDAVITNWMFIFYTIKNGCMIRIAELI